MKTEAPDHQMLKGTTKEVLDIMLTRHGRCRMFS